MYFPIYLQNKIKLFKDGMEFDAKYVRRRELNKYLNQNQLIYKKRISANNIKRENGKRRASDMSDLSTSSDLSSSSSLKKIKLEIASN